MSTLGMEGKPSPVPAFGVFGAMIGAGTDNLLAGARTGLVGIITGAVPATRFCGEVYCLHHHGIA